MKNITPRKFICDYIKSYGFFIPKNRIKARWTKKNFGDKLTPYLIEKISGMKPVIVRDKCICDYYAMCHRRRTA